MYNLMISVTYFVRSYEHSCFSWLFWLLVAANVQSWNRLLSSLTTNTNCSPPPLLRAQNGRNMGQYWRQIPNTKYTKYRNYWVNSRFGHAALYLTSPQVCLVKTGSSPIETLIFVHIGLGLNPNEKHIHMYVPDLHLDLLQIETITFESLTNHQSLKLKW